MIRRELLQSAQRDTDEMDRLLMMRRKEDPRPGLHRFICCCEGGMGWMCRRTRGREGKIQIEVDRIQISLGILQIILSSQPDKADVPPGLFGMEGHARSSDL